MPLSTAGQLAICPTQAPVCPPTTSSLACSSSLADHKFGCRDSCTGLYGDVVVTGGDTPADRNIEIVAKVVAQCKV